MSFVHAAQRARGAANSVGGRVLTSPDHRALFNSAVLIAVLTLIAKFATLGRDIVVASRFGTSDANDALLAGWLLPGFLVGMVANGFVGGLIPVQVETRTKRGRERERAVVGEVMLLSTIAYVAISLFLLVGNRLLLPLVTQGYSDPKFELAAQIAIVYLPAVLITGIGYIWAGMLNSEDRFGLAAAAPMIVPLVSTAILVAYPTADIVWVAAGYVIGSGLQAAVLYLGVQKAGMSSRLEWHGLLPETRSVLKQCGALAANSVMFGGLVVVDTAMAATLGGGNQSILSYANKLIVPMLAISSTALGTAVLPYFSRLVANEDWNGLRDTVRTYTRLILALSIPATALLILFSHSLVRILFERGEFTPHDTSEVATVLATYALLIPIETLAILMSRLLLSMQAGRILVMISIGIFACNIVTDYVLKELMGVSGIALATVMNQVVSLVLLIYFWNRIQRDRGLLT